MKTLKGKTFCYSVLLLMLITHIEYCNATSNCQQEIASAYLDVATDMISKAKFNMPSCKENEISYISDTGTTVGKLLTAEDAARNSPTADDATRNSLTTDTAARTPLAADNAIINCTRLPVDCSDVFNTGNSRSGVYTIWPMSRVTEDKPVDVYCDMDTDGGGWTLIQRRGNFANAPDYFYKGWKDYKEGFGNIQEAFWLGNDNIFALTNQKLYSIRFDLEDWDLNKAYALYDSFWIDDEKNNYTLHVSGYSGNAGDSFHLHHNSQKFSTKDKDNDNSESSSCAETYKGAWWYNSCQYSNLNGLYIKDKSRNDAQGINWYHWKNLRQSMQSTEMKIRRKEFFLPKENVVKPLR